MVLKKLLSIFFGILISLVLCEIVLRIYNPFQSRVRGNEIILKSNYKRKVSIDPPINGLDREIKYSTNSIGFRGPEPPKDWDKAITLITVGGSTTECSLLSDDSTWTATLYKNMSGSVSDLWINNAGLDGCSSFGHLILMRDYIIKLKPDYVIFLVGINDLVKSSFKNEDGFLINREEAFWRTWLKKSELFTTMSNVYESFKSQKANVAHGNDPYGYKNNDLNLLDSAGRVRTEEQLKKYVPEYVTRITALIDICKTHGIKPIFVTQPKFDDENAYSWQVMQRYNDALLAHCRSNSVDCIDLGRSLPKNIAYYYDQIHYTNAGANKIAGILAPEILQIIQKK